MSKLLAIGLLSVLWLAAPLRAEVNRQPPPPPDKSVLATGKVVLPLESSSGRPTIEAKINGKGPFVFVFDTGAQGFVIDASLAKELELPVVGRAAMGDPDNPDAIEVDRVKMGTVEVGGVLLSGVIADSWERPAIMRQHLPGRGIFGLSMLSAFLVTFDYPNSKIIIESGALAPVGGENTLPWRAQGDGLPTVALVVDGKPFQAHIDTGSPGEITLPEKAREGFAYVSEPVIVGRGRTVNSEFEVWRGKIDGQAKLGMYVVDDPEVAFMSMLDSSGYANIGSGLLDDFAVTFDQKNGLVRFKEK